MEIIFLLISLVLSVSVIYSIGRLVYYHKELIKAYKRDDLLLPFHFIMGLIMALIFFITLCAFNNTFWHLPYYFK